MTANDQRNKTETTMRFHSALRHSSISILMCGGVVACDNIGGGGGDGSVFDNEVRFHYQVIFHESPLTDLSVITPSILSDVWTTGSELEYDTQGPWYGGESHPCEVEFTRYSDLTTNSLLYEDSLFAAIDHNNSVTSDAASLVDEFRHGAEDPPHMIGKVIRVFVLPRLATRLSNGSVVPNHWLGFANSSPFSSAFPGVFLSSRRITYNGVPSTFTHEMSHMLAPSTEWVDNESIFTHILTWPNQGIEKWEWDEGTQQLVLREATDLSVRVIVDVSGKSQCDAAWTKSNVRDISQIPPA